MKDAFFFQNVEAPRTSPDFGLKSNQWLKKGGGSKDPNKKR
jgi:hypothetical protein